MLEIDLQWQQIHIILEEAQQKKINSLESLSALAIPTEFHSYNGLPHGFGLGIGTIAEGWLNDAVRFWQSQSGATAIHSAKANAGRSSLEINQYKNIYENQSSPNSKNKNNQNGKVQKKIVIPINNIFI